MKHLASALLLTCLSLPVWAADDSLYRALGEKAGIKAVVADFVTRVGKHPLVREGFQDIDMPNFIMRLEQQLCEVSGGPCVYKGKDMKTIHDGLNITAAQFNVIVEELVLAMEAKGVPNAVQNKLLAKLAPMHRDIITK